MPPKLKGEEDEEEEQTTDEQTPDEEVETEESDEGEEEEVETEEVDLPDDEESDTEEKARGLLSGSTLGVSNKFLLGVGVAAILLVLLLRSMDSQSSTRQYESDEQVDEEIDEGSNESVERDVTDAGGSKGRFDPQAQDDAIGSVFG